MEEDGRRWKEMEEPASNRQKSFMKKSFRKQKVSENKVIPF